MCSRREKGKALEKKLLLCTDFPFFALWHTFMTLKNTRCSCYLPFFATLSFHSLVVFFSFLNVCMNNLIHAILWHEKERTGRKKSERTFDIYSFLFIFIISFSLNSFSWTRKIMWTQEMPSKLFWILRKIQSFLVSTATKFQSRGDLEIIFFFFAAHQI